MRMTVKETFWKIIADLPDTVTWDEIQHRIYLQQVVEESERQISDGYDVTQAQAEERLSKSLKEIPMQFDHVGFVTTEKKPGEVFVPATKVWVTNHEDSPYHVEWLRFEPDSPVTGPLRDGPHIGYRVDSVEAIVEAAEGLEVVLEPFDAGFAVAGFYKTPDGAMVEFVTYKDGPSPWS